MTNEKLEMNGFLAAFLISHLSFLISSSFSFFSLSHLSFLISHLSFF